jgi:hypothetical protein
MQELDWNDLRYVLATARTGRLAEAGRRTKVNETTIARRIARIEQTLGSQLFHRNAGVLIPTESGLRHYLCGMGRDGDRPPAKLRHGCQWVRFGIGARHIDPVTDQQTAYTRIRNISCGTSADRAGADIRPKKSGCHETRGRYRDSSRAAGCASIPIRRISVFT